MDIAARVLWFIVQTLFIARPSYLQVRTRTKGGTGGFMNLPNEVVHGVVMGGLLVYIYSLARKRLLKRSA